MDKKATVLLKQGGVTRCRSGCEGGKDMRQKKLWPMTASTKFRHGQLQEERTAQNISFSGTTVMAMTQSKETSSLLSSSAQNTLAQALLYKWE